MADDEETFTRRNLTDADRQLIRYHRAENARRLREKDFNYAPHAAEKAMGFQGDTTVIVPGRPAAATGDEEDATDES